MPDDLRLSMTGTVMLFVAGRDCGEAAKEEAEDAGGDGLKNGFSDSDAIATIGCEKG